MDIRENNEDNGSKEKKKINKSRLIWNILLWSLNIVVVALIVRWILKQNFTSFLDVFKSWKLPVYITVFLLLMLIKAFRYTQLQTSKLSFKKSIMGISLGYFLNSLIPARFGDLSRIIYLSSSNDIKNEETNEEEEKVKATPGDYIGSLVFEKLFDLFSLLLITAIIVFVTSIYLFEDIWPIIVVAFSFIILLIIAVVLITKYHKFFDRIIEWFVSKFRGELKQEINLSEQVKIYTKNLIRKPKKIILNVFLSLIIVLVDTILIYLILSIILVDLPIYLGILAGSIGFLSVIFPLLPGGLGTYEGSMVLALVFFDYVKELTLTASFSEHILRTAIYIIIGIPLYIIVLIKQRRKSKITKSNEKTKMI